MATQVTLNSGSVDSAGSLALKTNGTTTAVTIDTSQNVGINTSSPAKQLDLAASNTGITTGDPLNTLRFTDTDTTSAAGQPMGRIEWYSADSDGAGVKAYIQAQATDGSPDGDMIFATNHVSGGGTAERMRIQYDGSVGMGTSSPAVSGLEISRATGSATPTPVELRLSTTTSASDWSTTDPWGRLSFYSADSSSAGPKIISAIDVTALAASGGIGSLSFKLAATTTGTLTERMRIDSDGNVTIPTASSYLFVGSSTYTGDAASGAGGGFGNALNVGVCWASVDESSVAIFNRQGNDGTVVLIRQAGTTEGNISVSGTTVSYNGGHLSRWAQTITPKDESLVKGTVLSNLDEMNVYTDAEGNPVENEQLNKVKVSDVEGDANVAGVFVNWEHDEQHNVDEINMAMTGDMIIRIAQGVTVARGDLLMSAGDGTAKPQGDDIVRSKTIAKVTSTHVTFTYADGSFCVPCVLMAC
jgi:hypothetical protein